MKQPIGLNRRRFVQMVGGTSLLGAVSGPLGWASPLSAPARTPRFAYVGGGQGILVFSIAGDGRFIKLQTIASAHPVAMAISGGNLYVANGVSEYGGRPRGSVEAYGINAATGRLKFKNRAMLSLSAIAPRDLAVAPDGRSVVVAVYGGGAYNVLSVHEDGRLGRVSGILKETGSGPHALQAWAHPSAVLFDRGGRVLTADQGTDKLSVFSLSHGELTVVGRCEVTAGSGPSCMALEPGGKRLYVAHGLDGSLSSFDYDAKVDRILNHKQTVWVSAAGQRAALAMHPSGEMLYSSHRDGIQAWKTVANGSLEALPELRSPRVNALHATADGESLLALTGAAVLRIGIDKSIRGLALPVTVASVFEPVSIATL